MPQRILIAEDNPAVRNALRILLEGAGPWEIVEVQNGQQALAKAQELKPNLIILDLVMPVMDGLSAARQISKLLPDTPMLMYTMHWSPQVEVEAQKVGVRSVVAKSDSRLLVSTVQQLLAPESSSSQAATSATVTPDIPIPDAAPPPPVLETGSTAPSDKPADSSSGSTTDIAGNRPPN
jgi:CheY-like chemotaxis protein